VKRIEEGSDDWLYEPDCLLTCELAAGRGKVCPSCGHLPASLDYFGADPSTHDGLHHTCRRCRRLKQQGRRKVAS
jgi:hypothetical protein